MPASTEAFANAVAAAVTDPIAAAPTFAAVEKTDFNLLLNAFVSDADTLNAFSYSSVFSVIWAKRSKTSISRTFFLYQILKIWKQKDRISLPNIGRFGYCEKAL